MTAERKDDAGKAPVLKGFIQYFPRAIKAVAAVSQAGFEKYGAWGGWRGVPDGLSRYGDADVRHLLGEAVEGSHDLVDDLGQPGTRCLHMALHAWNALARLDKYLEENPDVPVRLPPAQEPQPIKEPEAVVLGTVPAGAYVTPESVRRMMEQRHRDNIAGTISRRLRGEPDDRWVPGIARPEPRPLPAKFEHAMPDIDQEYPPCGCHKAYCLAEVLGTEEVWNETCTQRHQCMRLRAEDDKRFDVV